MQVIWYNRVGSFEDPWISNRGRTRCIWRLLQPSDGSNQITSTVGTPPEATPSPTPCCTERVRPNVPRRHCSSTDVCEQSDSFNGWKYWFQHHQGADVYIRRCVCPAGQYTTAAILFQGCTICPSGSA